jgi:hypothetical protein
MLHLNSLVAGMVTQNSPHEAQIMDDPSESTTVLDIMEMLEHDDGFRGKQADLLARKRAAMDGTTGGDRSSMVGKGIVPNQRSSEEATTQDMIPANDVSSKTNQPVVAALPETQLEHNQTTNTLPGAYNDRPGAEPQRLLKSSRTLGTCESLGEMEDCDMESPSNTTESLAVPVAEIVDIPHAEEQMEDRSHQQCKRQKERMYGFGFYW